MRRAGSSPPDTSRPTFTPGSSTTPLASSRASCRSERPPSLRTTSSFSCKWGRTGSPRWPTTFGGCRSSTCGWCASLPRLGSPARRRCSRRSASSPSYGATTLSGPPRSRVGPPSRRELLRAVTEDGVSTQRLIMTTDGPAPEFVAENGLVDGMLRVAVESGVPPMQALQMVTINPATLFRIDGQVGGIGIGRRADLLLLEDLTTFRPQTVITGGRVVASDGELRIPLPDTRWDSYGSRPEFDAGLDLADPTLYPQRASGSDAELPVMHLRSAVISEHRTARVRAENGSVVLDREGRMLHAALLDRAGAWISRALVSGFAADLHGRASTYNTTTQLLVLGRDPRSMALAARRVRDLGGGIVVVKDKDVVFELALPITGMMSTLPFSEVVEQNRRLSKTVSVAGYEHHDILYTLLFLTCDFLPALRLTPLGLLDVKSSETLTVRQPLERTDDH